MADNRLPQQGLPREMTLEDLLRSTAIAIRTREFGLVTISRRLVLQYVANKRGGVHFDPDRKLDLPDKKQKKRGEQRAFHLMDLGFVRIGHLSGAEYELACLVDAIANAPWCSDLIELAREEAPEDFDGRPDQIRVWSGMTEADGSGWATFTRAPVESTGTGVIIPQPRED